MAAPKHFTAMWKSNNHIFKHFSKSFSGRKVDKTQNRVLGHSLTDKRGGEKEKKNCGDILRRAQRANRFLSFLSSWPGLSVVTAPAL